MEQVVLYQKKPTFINLNITHRCNFTCIHCPIGQRSQNEGIIYDVDINQLKRHTLGLKRWLKIFTLNVSGGEPLLYPHLFEFLKFCNNNRITVELITNGSLLNHENIKKISEIKLRHLTISLDGLEQTHDFIRNKKGSFLKAIESVKEIYSLNRSLKINGNFTIMSHNANQLGYFVRWFSAQDYLYNLTFQAVSLFPLRHGIGVKDYEKDPLWPKINMDEPINQLIRLKTEGAHIGNSVKQLNAMKHYFNDPIRACKIDENGCPVRYTSYFIEPNSIDPNSKILNCPMDHLTRFGSIGEISQDAEKIWNSKRAIQVKEKVKNCRQTCQVYFNCCYEDKTLVKYPDGCIISFMGRMDANSFFNKNSLIKLEQKSFHFYRNLAVFLKEYVKKAIFLVDYGLLTGKQTGIIKEFAKLGIHCEICLYYRMGPVNPHFKDLCKMKNISLNIFFPITEKEDFEDYARKSARFSFFSRIISSCKKTQRNIIPITISVPLCEGNIIFLKEVLLSLEKEEGIDHLELVALSNEYFNSETIQKVSDIYKNEKTLPQPDKLAAFLREILELTIQKRLTKLINTPEQWEDFVRLSKNPSEIISDERKSIVKRKVFIKYRDNVNLEPFMKTAGYDFETLWLSEYYLNANRKFNDTEVYLADFVNNH
ncbi:MAG: radical SAM protein [Nanoarchaeota archaeon]|nr:radical SAM protein [Nanoarchaeota archaeon]